jgi:hypothetical protein
MRKLLIPVAVAVSALAVAAPASAQYYGGQNYGYSNGYNQYGRGYNRSNGGYESNRLIAANRERMAKIHNDIEMAAQRRIISPNEAARLHSRAAQFDRELAMLARGGMTGQEGAMFDARADRLAQEVLARTGQGYGYGNRYGYNRW